jgi:hypothetical protein
MRKKEPRIDARDPLAHRARYVSLTVAAEFLEVSRNTLMAYLDERLLEYVWFGDRRKIEVAELVAFETRQRVTRKAG